MLAIYPVLRIAPYSNKQRKVVYSPVNPSQTIHGWICDKPRISERLGYHEQEQSGGSQRFGSAHHNAIT